jgi:hypothetical protein
MKDKKILTEINRIKEIMGVKLLTEQPKVLSDVITSLVNLTSKGPLKNKLTSLSKNINLTSKDVKNIFDEIKLMRNVSPTVLSTINKFEQSIVNKYKDYSEYIRKQVGLNSDEDAIMDSIIKTMKDTYGDLLSGNLLDDFTINISKNIEKIKKEINPPKPIPPKPEENFSKVINDISPDFTKFAANKFDKMSEIAKKINEDAISLINNQNQLSANEILDLENSITKGFNDLYYGNSEIIKFIEKEIEQGLKSNNKNLSNKYKLVKNKFDELKKTIGDDWGIVKVLTPNTGKFGFWKKTIKETIKDWQFLGTVVKRMGRVIAQSGEKFKKYLDPQYQMKSIEETSKTLEGSSVVPFWKKQIYLTVFGSGRGIPKKSLSKIIDGKVIKLDNPYQNIMDLFPKNKVGKAWASLIIEKLIKIIKTTVYLNVISNFYNYIKFNLTDKKLQKTYGNCIYELSKKFKETGKSITELSPDEYPKCFKDLVNTPNIENEVLQDIIVRGYYFADTESFIAKSLDSLKFNESFFSFIVSSRAQVITEVVKLIDDALETQKTGDDSILDGIIGDLKVELDKAQKESPVKISDTPSTSDETSTPEPPTPVNTDNQYTNDVEGFKKYIKNTFEDDNPVISGTKDSFTYEDIEFKYNNGKFD